MSSAPSSGGSWSAPPPVYEPSPQELAHRRSVALNNQGVNAYDRGDNLEALRLYHLSLQAAPPGKDTTQTRQNIAHVHGRLGLDAYKRKEYAEALRNFELANINFPGRKVVLDHIAVAKQMLEAEQRERQHAREMEEARRRVSGLLNTGAVSVGNAPAANSSSGPSLDFMDGRTPPGGPGTSVSSGTATGQGDDLFSRGDRGSAPVVAGPRNAALAGSAPTAPAATAQTPQAEAKRPLLTGPALEAAKDRAKSEAARDLGAQFFLKREYGMAKHYLEEAVKLDPSCDFCKAALAKAQKEDGNTLMSILFFGKPEQPSSEQAIDDHELDRMLRATASRHDYVMSAFQYGKGDWDAGLAYLRDWQRAAPGDQTVADALKFAQSLRASVQASEGAAQNR